jgi:hypothetical protein
MNSQEGQVRNIGPVAPQALFRDLCRATAVKLPALFEMLEDWSTVACFQDAEILWRHSKGLREASALRSEFSQHRFAGASSFVRKYIEIF